MKITASADEYMYDLLKTPVRAMVLFLDVIKDIPFRDKERLKGQVFVVAKCFSCIPGEETTEAINWLRSSS